MCTAEVAALCLCPAGDANASLTREACLDVVTRHDRRAKHPLPVDPGQALHQQLRALAGQRAGVCG